VEHYYQAQKFASHHHGANVQQAADVIEAIHAAASPEEAARTGRAAQRQRPDLVRPHWDTAKLAVMEAALRAKFTTHPGPQQLLLSTTPNQLVESSPNDLFWGRGLDGTGHNHLGRLLMKTRQELLSDAQQKLQ
jgi:diaminohydroxyphosphoribosylaminopyrimidine deaminase/5-amino-6-(5-phosphoribosylamino)uracil reductase